MQKFLRLAVVSAFCLLPLHAQPVEYDSAAARRISKATPAALPQLRRPERPRTDAQDVDLRGRVRSVTFRHTDDADPRFPRKMLTLEEFYGEDGDRTRTVEWDNRHPVAVTIFGYVDGMRVSRTNLVEAVPGPDLLLGRSIQTIPQPDNSGVNRDKRYDMREVRTYDSRGRITEIMNLDNTGRILTRTTYTYKADGNRVLNFYGAGKEPIAKVAEIVDPTSGQVREEWLYDENGKVNLIRYNTYKFDDRGNWIVKKTTERATTSGDTRERPVETTYRSITYY